MDITCNIKLLNRFRNKFQQEIRDVASHVHFDQVEIDSLVNIYVKLLEDLDPNAVFVHRVQLRSMFYEMLDMPNDFLVERIMAGIEQDTLPNVTITTFIKCMSIFLRGTFEERCRYCFAVYDVVGEGIIKRDQLMALLKSTVIKLLIEDVEEIAKDLTDMTIKKFDHDADGMISYADYVETVRAQPQLMETFGHCLPEREAVNAYLQTFTHNLPKF